MFLNPWGLSPPENRPKITPMGRSHADDYVVIVVKDFNSKYAVLTFFHLHFCCNCISQNSPETRLNALTFCKIMHKIQLQHFFSKI